MFPAKVAHADDRARKYTNPETGAVRLTASRTTVKSRRIRRGREQVVGGGGRFATHIYVHIFIYQRRTRETLAARVGALIIIKTSLFDNRKKNKNGRMSSGPNKISTAL